MLKSQERLWLMADMKLPMANFVRGDKSANNMEEGRGGGTANGKNYKIHTNRMEFGDIVERPAIFHVFTII